MCSYCQHHQSTIIDISMQPTSALHLLLLVAICTTGLMAQTADDDQVDASYPGYPHTFYSGNFMIKTNPDPKVIHYVFFPSLNDKSKDPVVLWLTGGPGCSSLLATFHQNGPFTFEPGTTTLSVNEQSWNKRANLLYLEVPAGVGFSVGPEDEVITDEIITQNTMSALRIFFARFPAYRKNDLFLTGHGYAGIFIAKIAQAIIQENNDPYVIYNDNFKLKGILMGNPCVNPDQCHGSGAQKSSYYHYEFLYHRGFFTAKTWNEFRGICTLDYNNQFCYTKRVEMDGIFNKTNTSMYNVYDKCYRTQNDTEEQLGYINTGCEDNLGILTFLNDPDVRKSWNIQVEKQWEPCNKKIYLEYQGSNNAFQVLPFLIKNNLRIWVYSGDLDSYIPIIGTKKWIQDLRHTLDMPLRRVWREWWVPGRHKHQDQVGGFIWELRDLTFVSVKGAGFRAAYDQPVAMSEVLNGFLDGKTLPFKSD